VVAIIIIIIGVLEAAAAVQAVAAQVTVINFIMKKYKKNISMHHCFSY